jgi:hypothetical protein
LVVLLAFTSPEFAEVMSVTRLSSDPQWDKENNDEE